MFNWHKTCTLKLENLEATLNSIEKNTSNTYTSKCTLCLLQITLTMFYEQQHLPSTLYLSLGQHKTIQGNISHG